MVSIRKMLVDRHKFWMDDSNWVDQSGDLKYKILKKTLLESIIRSKNISEFSLRILDDIDCLACLLNLPRPSGHVLDQGDRSLP